MKLPLFQVDAFTNCLFGGSPAAVVLLVRWLPDRVMAQSRRRTIWPRQLLSFPVTRSNTCAAKSTLPIWKRHVL